MQRKLADCSSTLYVEPTLLFGVDGDGKSVSRLRAGLGFVAVGCGAKNVETAANGSATRFLE